MANHERTRVPMNDTTKTKTEAAGSRLGARVTQSEENSMFTNSQGAIATIARQRILAQAVALVVGILGLCTSAQGLDELAVLSTNANPAATAVEVVIQARHDDAVQGFSVVLGFPASEIQCTGASVSGTVTETIVGGDPEFFNSIIDNVAGTVIVGAILDLDPISPVELTASPTSAYDLVKLMFDVPANALPGVYPLELLSGVGSPPADNVLSSGGFSTLPELVDGTFTVNNTNEFVVQDVTSGVGAEFDAIVICSHDFDLEGLSIAMSYDTAALTLESIDTAGLAIEILILANDPASEIAVEYFLVDMATPGYATVAMVFDFVPPFADAHALPAGDDQSIARFHFDGANLQSLANTTTILDLTDTAGPGTNVVTYLDGAVGVTPVLVDGTVTFAEADGFKRGDCNADFLINLADPIYFLTWNFNGGIEPPCMDSADLNDDGVANIADPIYLLNYLFNNGLDPKPPFPSCGDDPTTTDLLGCSTYSGC